MTEFDFDVITCPSGPARQGRPAFGATPQEAPPPSPPSLRGLERNRDQGS
jgi:hypothetical protein